MTGDRRIRELDAETVDRIAAGEVVERPASAVKELVENALDADAGRVEVAVESGGREGIVVRDDGVGMTERAVRRAVRQHTTSKIDDAGDLASGVGTLGFRGEALHAIGTVSRLTIRTRPRDADGDAGGATAGTELVVEGGEVTDVGPVGRPPGTTVEVRDLFFNLPARRKYLKTPATEFGHVQRTVAAYALANPDAAVSLSHDGRETFATAGGGDRRAAVMAVYGREVAADMIDVTGTHDPGGPLSGVRGLVSGPETNRAGREYLNAFVDGRYVTAGPVRDAVVAAYGDQLAADRYPFAVLMLDVPPGSVDVNVHPRKLRVKFADPEGVARQVEGAVERALLDEGILRSSAPRGRSAPEQTAIDPTSGDADGAGGGDGRTGDGAAGTTPADADAGDASGTGGTDGPAAAEGDGAAAGGADSADSADSADPGPDGATGTDARTPGGTDGPPADGARAGGEPDPSRGAGGVDPAVQATLDGADAARRSEYDHFPPLRVLGQLRDTYVVAEADGGLLLIDQHAADERVHYERLRERFAGGTTVTTQALAEPVELELTAREAALFEARADALARLGFRADRVDDRTVAVRTVPALVADAAGPELVRDVLTGFAAEDRSADGTVEAVADDLLADMACHPAITGDTSLTEGSVAALLSALDECENPYACPHGRPTVTHLGADEIDERFERDYPGH